MRAGFQIVEGGLDGVLGIFAGGIRCGIKNKRRDLAVIYSRVPAWTAGVFTQNQVQAAPVTVTRNNLQKTKKLQLVVVNSGVANACTGKKGLEDAERMAELGAQIFDLPQKELAGVASTGVIGEFLPMDKIEQGLLNLRNGFPEQFFAHDAALAIMTTDTVPKEHACQFSIGGQEVHLAGIAKGSGMIRPNMATMLSFLACDAEIEPASLERALKIATQQSFNRITVDGDTSTNDMVLILANGQSGAHPIKESDSEFSTFQEALNWLTGELARDIVRDGEGATKFVKVVVKGGKNEEEARKCAYTIAESPLVKTACFGEDPNWGRIVAAAGRSGAKFDPNALSVIVNGVSFVEKGMGARGCSRQEMKAVMREKEIEVVVNLGVGEQRFEVWTCDLSFDYVKINSHYS